MPLYSYKCGEGTSFTRLLKLVDYDAPQTCECCGQVAQKVITPPMIFVDYPAYISPATGKLIQGKKQHEDDLKRSGCRILEPGESRDAERARVDAEKKFEKNLDNTVEQVFGHLNA